MSRLLWVSLWFQLIWLVAVLGQEAWQWLTLLLGGVTLLYAAATDVRGLKSIIALGAIGIGLDWLNLYLGVLVFKQAYVPVWLAVLWLSFIWYAKHWVPYIIKYNKLVMVILVGGCGALSYWAGNRFSAVEFSFSLPWTLLVLALQWCCISWLIMRVFANDYSSSVDTGNINTSRRNKG